MRTYTVRLQAGTKRYGIFDEQNRLVEGGFLNFTAAADIANGWMGNALR